MRTFKCEPHDGRNEYTISVARAEAGHSTCAIGAELPEQLLPSWPCPFSALDLCERDGRNLQGSRSHAFALLLGRSFPGKGSVLHVPPDRPADGPKGEEEEEDHAEKSRIISPVWRERRGATPPN